MSAAPNQIYLIGSSPYAPYPALEAVNGRLFADLSFRTPIGAVPAEPRPTFRVPQRAIADVAPTTLGMDHWSTRLLAALSPLGPLRAIVLPSELRIRGSRKAVRDAGALFVPTVVANDWLDAEASDVDWVGARQRVKFARRLVLRPDFVAPAPVFVLGGFGRTALSPAAAALVAALAPVGTWLEPLSCFSHARPMCYPPSDGVTGSWEATAG